jgi:hypothetical protein
MKRFLTILSIALLAGCSTISVSYDYDKSTDFSKYKTYAFSDDVAKLKISDLNRERIMKAIETEMTARGMSKSETPDALIDLEITAQERVQANANSMGGGGMAGRGRFGYGGGFTTTTIDYNKYVDGSLFINLVDKTSEKIVWQGRGTKTLDENATPEKRDANIKYAVKTIFNKYPVKVKPK